MGKLDGILRKAQQYAQRNPDKVNGFADKAGSFVNKRTKGKYAGQIDGALNKLEGLTGQRRRDDGRGPDERAGGSW
ncbi:antitoxin [Blastococcus sp. Marseille-P5729]|uniref:antitoxin n=1 Tax=Blastococcus sp. Marseille-P5729 TaxID=2086582 RepID=UPI000D0FA3B7|nr:antitoxin [Blastococcus sp. Marseille-P5729]